MVDGPSVSASRYAYEPVEGLVGSIFVALLSKEAVLDALLDATEADTSPVPALLATGNSTEGACEIMVR